MAAMGGLWGSKRAGLVVGVSPPNPAPSGGGRVPAKPRPLCRWAAQALSLGPWGALGVRAVGAALLGLGALRLLVPLLPPT